MHVNQRIRQAAADRIAATGAFTVVSTNRSANLSAGHLPAAVIGTSTDEVAIDTKDDPPDERRTITMTVTIVEDASDAETIDDRMDDLRVTVEEALAGDLDGLAWWMEHTGGDLQLGSDEDGDQWLAFYVLSWTVQVRTQQGKPQEIST